MKSHKLIATFCCFLVLGSFLTAADADANIAEPESLTAETSKETRILHRLLEMEDEELTQLRQTIERIERMSHEERAQLRSRIDTIHRMPPREVDRLRKKFKAIPREHREAMRARWMKMSPEEHAELRSRLSTMSPEERRTFLKEHDLLPPHPPRLRKGPPPEDLDDAATDTSSEKLETR